MMNKIEEYLSSLLNVCFQYFKSREMIPLQLYKIVKTPADIHKGVSFEIIEYLKLNKDALIEKHHTLGLTDAYDEIQTFSQLIHGKKLIMEEGVNCFKDWLFSFGNTKNGKNGKPLRSKEEIIGHEDYLDLKKLMKIDGYIAKNTEDSKHLKKKKEKEMDLDKNNRLKHNEDEDSDNLQEINSEENLETHPKSEKLVELLSEYFLEEKSISDSSKTIVFTQSRNSASELKKLLNNVDLLDENSCSKLIRAEIFIGQANLDGEGMNEKLEIETIALFKKNVYNTLIATCIGEEGLDIGEVDLIICYDSGFSPIRMIQRIGRTGRERAGKVYVLLMEGKEFASYTESEKKHKELIKLLKNNSCNQVTRDTYEKGYGGRQTKNSKRTFVFYGFNPRMIPSNVNPVCRIVKSRNSHFLPGMESMSNTEEEGEEELRLVSNTRTKKNRPKECKLASSNAVEIPELEIDIAEGEDSRFIRKEKGRPEKEKTTREVEVENRLKELASNINNHGKKSIPKESLSHTQTGDNEKVFNITNVSYDYKNTAESSELFDVKTKINPRASNPFTELLKVPIKSISKTDLSRIHTLTSQSFRYDYDDDDDEEEEEEELKKLAEHLKNSQSNSNNNTNNDKEYGEDGVIENKESILSDVSSKTMSIDKMSHLEMLSDSDSDDVDDLEDLLEIANSKSESSNEELAELSSRRWVDTVEIELNDDDDDDDDVDFLMNLKIVKDSNVLLNEEGDEVAVDKRSGISFVGIKQRIEGREGEIERGEEGHDVGKTEMVGEKVDYSEENTELLNQCDRQIQLFEQERSKEGDINGFLEKDIGVKKRTYEVMNEKLKKEMECEYDPSEWEERNKDKAEIQPKLDPKARFKIQKNQSNLIKSLLTTTTIEDNQIRSPPNSDVPNETAFHYLLEIAGEDSQAEEEEEEEEDKEEIEFMENMSKQWMFKKLEENSQLCNSKYESLTFRKENPYINNDDSLNILKKEYKK